MANDNTSKRKFTPEEMREIMEEMARPETQAMIQKIQKQDLKPANTEEQREKFMKLAEKTDARFIRIDPTTGKPHKEAEKFYWKIVNAFPLFPDDKGVAADGERLTGHIRVTYMIQRYLRKIEPGFNANVVSPNGAARKPEGEVPYNERNQDNELVSPGDAFKDAEEFMQQFKREED
jgi:hypothetical protein